MRGGVTYKHLAEIGENGKRGRKPVYLQLLHKRLITTREGNQEEKLYYQNICISKSWEDLSLTDRMALTGAYLQNKYGDRVQFLTLNADEETSYEIEQFAKLAPARSNDPLDFKTATNFMKSEVITPVFEKHGVKIVYVFEKAPKNEKHNNKVHLHALTIFPEHLTHPQRKEIIEEAAALLRTTSKNSNQHQLQECWFASSAMGYACAEIDGVVKMTAKRRANHSLFSLPNAGDRAYIPKEIKNEVKALHKRLKTLAMIARKEKLLNSSVINLSETHSKAPTDDLIDKTYIDKASMKKPLKSKDMDMDAKHLLDPSRPTKEEELEAIFSELDQLLADSIIEAVEPQISPLDTAYQEESKARRYREKSTNFIVPRQLQKPNQMSNTTETLTGIGGSLRYLDMHIDYGSF